MDTETYKMRHIKNIKNVRHRFVAFITIIGLLTLNIVLAPVAAHSNHDDDEANVDEVPSEDDYDAASVPTARPLAMDRHGNELKYVKPKYDMSEFHFVDTFDDVIDSQKKWIKSQAKKDDIADDIAMYDGIWKWEPPQRIIWKSDIGLVLKSRAKHAAIASRLFKAFTFKENKPLVVQYEVTLQNGQPCGGAYLKLLSNHKSSDDLTKFNDKTPYTIMFGPDKCGHDIKMHFIFRHVNPVNGSITEKHCRKPKDRLEEPFKDRLPHLYQLVVKPDNTFEIRVDHNVINSGSLLTDFTPEVNPPREIDDPNDKKPDDWDEREKIPDPTAVKPDDWDDDAPPQIPDPNAIKPDDWLEDEPEMIPDPGAMKPDDWDTEMDGEWEAPLVDNPKCEKAPGCGKWKAPLIPNKKYKGKWRAPLLENPNYRGKWSPRRIPNPDFFEDLTPFQMTPIVAVGLELWSMASDILFDNIIITDSVKVADDFAAQTFDIKRKFVEKESESIFTKVITPIRSFLKENPWAFAVVGVVIAIIVTLLCLLRFSKKVPYEDDPKKTDAPQPDDDITVAGGDIIDSTEKHKPSSPKMKKSDLDAKELNGGETMITAQVEHSPKGKVKFQDEKKTSDTSEDKESNESFEIENDNVEEIEGDESTNVKQRKKRVRKDES